MPPSIPCRWLLSPIVVLVLAVGLLAACGRASPSPIGRTSAPTHSPTIPAVVTSTPRPATATLAPTPTQPRPAVLLVAPDKADPNLAADVKAVLQELAAASGIELRVQTGLSAGDLKPEVKVVVALPPDPGLAQLAAGAPQVQFAGVGLDGVGASANLSLVGSQGSLASQQAFVAGYISAIVTPDWRVGVLSLAGDPLGERAAQAFLNGASFFCGLCKPAYPPFVTYPTAASAASPQDWNAAADALLAKAVQTVYVFPGLATPELYAYLVKANVQLIGGGTPPDDARASWIATIHASAGEGLRQLWPDLVAGKGGRTLPMALTLADTSAGFLPGARQRLVQEVLQNLLAGQINPDQVPEP